MFFARTYAEIPGLHAQLVKNQLNIREGTMSVKQASRNFRPGLELQINQDI